MQALSDRGSVLVRDPLVLDVVVPSSAFDVPSSPGGGSDVDELASSGTAESSVGETPSVYSYRCIQVKDPALFLVNGKPLQSGRNAPQIQMAAFDQ